MKNCRLRQRASLTRSKFLNKKLPKLVATLMRQKFRFQMCWAHLCHLILLKILQTMTMTVKAPRAVVTRIGVQCEALICFNFSGIIKYSFFFFTSKVSNVLPKQKSLQQNQSVFVLLSEQVQKHAYNLENKDKVRRIYANLREVSSFKNKLFCVVVVLGDLVFFRNCC